MFWNVLYPSVSYTHLSKNTSNPIWSVIPNTRITSAKTESALLHVNYATECVVGVTYMA